AQRNPDPIGVRGNRWGEMHTFVFISGNSLVAVCTAKNLTPFHIINLLIKEVARPVIEVVKEWGLNNFPHKACNKGLMDG
ncbi:MAG: hypothetical protein JXB07_11480, partial [Anaerolineae bacterium]|nr:hypothetical protein [Anaerolineae bacterium]